MLLRGIGLRTRTDSTNVKESRTQSGRTATRNLLLLRLRGTGSGERVRNNHWPTNNLLAPIFVPGERGVLCLARRINDSCEGSGPLHLQDEQTAHFVLGSEAIFL